MDLPDKRVGGRNTFTGGGWGPRGRRAEGEFFFFWHPVAPAQPPTSREGRPGVEAPGTRGGTAPGRRGNKGRAVSPAGPPSRPLAPALVSSAVPGRPRGRGGEGSEAGAPDAAALVSLARPLPRGAQGPACFARRGRGRGPGSSPLHALLPDPGRPGSHGWTGNRKRPLRGRRRSRQCSGAPRNLETDGYYPQTTPREPRRGPSAASPIMPPQPGRPPPHPDRGLPLPTAPFGSTWRRGAGWAIDAGGGEARRGLTAGGGRLDGYIFAGLEPRPGL